MMWKIRVTHFVWFRYGRSFCLILTVMARSLGVWCLYQRPSFWSKDVKSLVHILKEEVSSLHGWGVAFKRLKESAPTPQTSGSRIQTQNVFMTKPFELRLKLAICGWHTDPWFFPGINDYSLWKLNRRLLCGNSCSSTIPSPSVPQTHSTDQTRSW